jgi:glycosyltransferase involved in cell wall biosynthesis
MSPPLVSVVLPVYNREATLARAVESVLTQSFRDFELIVVDDGSTDGSRAVLERFGAQVRLIAGPHRGPYAARNMALQHARGELIAFMDSDDVWLPHRLASQIPLMARPEVGLVFGDVRIVTPDGPGPSSMFRVSPPARGNVSYDLTRWNFVPTITVLVRRRCLLETGGFVEAPLGADYLAWFRIAQRHELDFVADFVADYSVHPGGISANLGRSLVARMGQFADELEQTGDATARAQIRRILFNCSVSLVLAVLRGRAAGVRGALPLAFRTAWKHAGIATPRWATSFAVDQLRMRSRKRVLA